MENKKNEKTWEMRNGELFPILDESNDVLWDADNMYFYGIIYDDEEDEFRVNFLGDGGWQFETNGYAFICQNEDIIDAICCLRDEAEDLYRRMPKERG